MNYKHIIGDLYEFTDAEGDLTTIRLKNIGSFTQASEDESCTVLYSVSSDSYIIIKIKYAEFQELMKVYVENEMLSNAFCGYPVYQYSLDGSYTPPEQAAPKEARTGDYPDPHYHITTTGGKKK